MKRFTIPILFVSVLVGCTLNASSQPGSLNATASGSSRVYERGGTIFVEGASGSPVTLTRGDGPTVSPDGTTIAFVRDPLGQHPKTLDGFVLQAWLIHLDGSGLRKLGQEQGCCIGASVDLYWSPDGSSIVLIGNNKHRFDVG